MNLLSFNKYWHWEWNRCVCLSFWPSLLATISQELWRWLLWSNVCCAYHPRTMKQRRIPEFVCKQVSEANQQAQVSVKDTVSKSKVWRGSYKYNRSVICLISKEQLNNLRNRVWGAGADDEARWKAENSQRRETAAYGSGMSPREPSHLELLTLRHQTYDIVSSKTCRTPRFRDPKSCNTRFYYWPNELQLASST